MSERDPMRDALTESFASMREEIDELQAERVRLRKALTVYADEESWEDVTRRNEDWPRFEYCGDDGNELPWELARAALARTEQP